MTELEILDNPETYVDIINLYRKCKSLTDVKASYKFININEQEENIRKEKVNNSLIPVGLLISCSYSIMMLGGDPDILKPIKRK